MSENKRVTIPFLEKVLKPIVSLVHTKADKTDIVQSDWNQIDTTKSDFIKNKPNIPSITGLATETYVNEQVAALVDSSPDTLNTLNELAAALGDDPNFATTTATEIGKKVDKTTTVNGKALSGNIILNASDVGALPNTTVIPSIEGLATETYVDETIAANQPDWNAKQGESGYIANRTHWAEENAIIVPMGEYTGENGTIILTEPLNILPEENKTYNVHWNGTEYKCVAKSLTMEGVIVVMLGNTAAIGLVDTGEPFLFAIEQNGAFGAIHPDGYAVIMALDGSSTANIGITYNGTLYHTIAHEFLPEYIYGYKRNELYPVTTLTFEEDSSEYGFTEALPFSLVEGNSYTVIFNGESFKATAAYVTLDPESNIRGLGLGDIRIVETGEPSGAYPFMFIEVPTEMAAVMGVHGILGRFDESLPNEVSFGIYENKAYKVPDEFLPEKTHWENKEDAEILPEIGVQALEGDPFGPLFFNKKAQLIIGDTYKVIFNDNEYLCEYKQTPQHIVENFIAYLGNGAFVGDTSTSEPFGIYILSDAYAQEAGVDALVLFTDGSTRGTLAIYEPAGKIHKLDAKFLPDGIATEAYVDEKVAGFDTTGLATEEYVNNAIAAIPETDLSDYYTKEQTDNQINAAKPDISGLASISYVDTKVANLVDSSPDTLNTLNELATALGNDPNFATTVAYQIGNKVDKTTTVNGKALYGNIVLAPEDIGAERAGVGTEQALARLYIKNGSSLAIRSTTSKAENEEYTMGYAAVALGSDTEATGSCSFAEGNDTSALADVSHSEGAGTIAASVYQHVQGRYNIADESDRYAHIIGNGAGRNDRTNAHTVDWNGNAWYKGDVFTKGTSQDDAKKLATEEFVNYTVDAIQFPVTMVNGKTGSINLTANDVLADPAGTAIQEFNKLHLKPGKAVSIRTGWAASEDEEYSLGLSAIALGPSSKARGNYSYTLGSSTEANGLYSYAGGYHTQAKADCSHADGLCTIASSFGQYVLGTSNIEDADNKYIYIIGNGELDRTICSNAHTIDWSGLGWFAGGLKVGGTGQDDAAAVSVLTANDLVAITNDEIDSICGAAIVAASEVAY